MAKLNFLLVLPIFGFATAQTGWEALGRVYNEGVNGYTLVLDTLRGEIPSGNVSVNVSEVRDWLSGLHDHIELTADSFRNTTTIAQSLLSEAKDQEIQEKSRLTKTQRELEETNKHIDAIRLEEDIVEKNINEANRRLQEATASHDAAVKSLAAAERKLHKAKNKCIWGGRRKRAIERHIIRKKRIFGILFAIGAGLVASKVAEPLICRAWNGLTGKISDLKSLVRNTKKSRDSQARKKSTSIHQLNSLRADLAKMTERLKQKEQEILSLNEQIKQTREQVFKYEKAVALLMSIESYVRELSAHSTAVSDETKDVDAEVLASLGAVIYTNILIDPLENMSELLNMCRNLQEKGVKDLGPLPRVTEDQADEIIANLKKLMTD